MRISTTTRTRMLAAAAGVSLILYAGDAGTALAEPGDGDSSSGATTSDSTTSEETDDEGEGDGGADVTSESAGDAETGTGSTGGGENNSAVGADAVDTGTDPASAPDPSGTGVPAATVTAPAPTSTAPPAGSESPVGSVDIGTGFQPGSISASAGADVRRGATDLPEVEAGSRSSSGVGRGGPDAPPPSSSSIEHPTIPGPPLVAPLAAWPGPLGSAATAVLSAAEPNETVAQATDTTGADSTPVAQAAGLLTLLGLPLLGGGSTAPTNPMPWTLLWFVRRFCNSQPEATAAPTVNPYANGTVTGDLNLGDPDDDTLRYTHTGVDAGSTLIIQPDGTFTYTPGGNLANVGGQDTFTVKASDNTHLHFHGLRGLLALFTGQDPHSRSVQITVDIPAANTPPVIDPDVEPILGTPDPTSGAVVVDLSGLVSDPDGDPLSFTTDDPGVDFGPDNAAAFTYTPSFQVRHDAAVPGHPGTHQVVVTVDDGRGGTQQVAISIPIDSVNADPILSGSDPSGTTDPATGVLTGTLETSVTDPDGDPISFTPLTEVPTTLGGTVTVNSDGTFTYTPDPAARHNAAADTATPEQQNDTFTVTVDDGHGGTRQITITVLIEPANADPTATASTPTQPTAGTGIVTGSVAVADADGDALSYTVVGATRTGANTFTTDKGTIVFDSTTGAYTYTPSAQARRDASYLNAPDTAKSDIFTILVDDGHGGSDTIEVTATIAGLSAPGAPSGGVQVGPDGSAYQTT